VGAGSVRIDFGGDRFSRWLFDSCLVPKIDWNTKNTWETALPEVTVVIRCEERHIEQVRETMWMHKALSVGSKPEPA
jgi:hypothetical protein